MQIKLSHPNEGVLLHFLGGPFILHAKCVLDDFDERSPFPFLAVNDWFTMGAAQWTKLMHVPLHQLHRAHAAFAKILLAFGTVIGRSRRRMVFARQGAGWRLGRRAAVGLFQV